jgi:agmatine/peptidylarginine deiminase
MILEGGSIEYNGDKVLLTTKKCLLNPNRNANLSQKQIEKKLKKYFGVKKILWLKHGFLQGDDTDSHIDTLARFCNKNTICYTKCTNKNDPHYQELKKMQKELKSFTDKNNKPFKLISLPLPKAVFDTKDNHRLPATYANFLILKKHILLPTYNDKKNDNLAKRKLKKIFKDKKIIKINSLSLIKQHGSLHCASMQIPK